MDHQGFARTLYALSKPGARAVLSFNNPYSSLVRGRIKDYFASGATGVYGGMASRGAPAHCYHRTLEEYLDSFLSVGFRLAKLADVGARRYPFASTSSRLPFAQPPRTPQRPLGS